MTIVRKLTRRLIGRPAPRPLPIVEPAETPREFAAHVFLCGLHRSGTTLLEQRLGALVAASVLRAPVPENEGQHLQDVFPIGRTHGGPGRFAFAPKMHLGPVDADTAARHRARLHACWTPWAVGGSDLLVEKSPPNLTRIPYLRSVFPGARFVVITRDPRVVAAATAKWSGASQAEMIFHWHVAHDAAHAALGPDCAVTSYEALCADPGAEVERLVDALGLPRRATPAPVDPRFETVENTNATYLADLTPIAVGEGAWRHFGYDL